MSIYSQFMTIEICQYYLHATSACNSSSTVRAFTYIPRGRSQVQFLVEHLFFLSSLFSLLLFFPPSSPPPFFAPPLSPPPFFPSSFSPSLLLFSPPPFLLFMLTPSLRCSNIILVNWLSSFNLNMLVADMPEEVQALCTAVVWRAPFEPIEAILSYQLEFVSDYEDFTISHQSHDRIYLTTQQEKSPGTLVRVSMVHSYIVKSAPPPPPEQMLWISCHWTPFTLPFSGTPPPPEKLHGIFCQYMHCCK